MPQRSRYRSECSGDRSSRYCRRLVGKLGRDQITALAFNVCGDVSAAFGALYGIALPVAETLTSVDQVRACINTDASGDQASARSITALLAALLVTAAQELKKLSALMSIAINPAIRSSQC